MHCPVRQATRKFDMSASELALLFQGALQMGSAEFEATRKAAGRRNSDAAARGWTWSPFGRGAAPARAAGFPTHPPADEIRMQPVAPEAAAAGTSPVINPPIERAVNRGKEQDAGRGVFPPPVPPRTPYVPAAALPASPRPPAPRPPAPAPPPRTAAAPDDIPQPPPRAPPPVPGPRNNAPANNRPQGLDGRRSRSAVVGAPAEGGWMAMGRAILSAAVKSSDAGPTGGGEETEGDRWYASPPPAPAARGTGRKKKRGGANGCGGSASDTMLYSPYEDM